MDYRPWRRAYPANSADNVCTWSAAWWRWPVDGPLGISSHRPISDSTRWTLWQWCCAASTEPSATPRAWGARSLCCRLRKKKNKENILLKTRVPNSTLSENIVVVVRCLCAPLMTFVVWRNNKNEEVPVMINDDSACRCHKWLESRSNTNIAIFTNTPSFATENSIL